MDNNDKLSRRHILQGATVLGASATLAACGDDEAPAGPNPDIVILNRLLSAEYTAIAAYTAGAMVLTSPPMGDPLAQQSLILRQIATRWQAQHREHAAVLVSAITAIGGTPVTEASVMFTPPSGFTGTVANVLRLAANLERGAALAYNDAVKSLSSAANRFLSSNIQGDETQHFIVLHSLLQQVAGAGPEIISGINDVVPVPFVSTVTPAPMGGMGLGLQSVTDFTYT